MLPIQLFIHDSKTIAPPIAIFNDFDVRVFLFKGGGENYEHVNDFLWQPKNVEYGGAYFKKTIHTVSKGIKHPLHFSIGSPISKWQKNVSN